MDNLERQRIKLIELMENKSRPKFAKELGLTSDVLKHILDGNTKNIKTGVAEKLEASTGIRAQWWITGKGAMYVTFNDGMKRKEPLTNLFENWGKLVIEAQVKNDLSPEQMAGYLNCTNKRYAEITNLNAEPTIEEYKNFVSYFRVSPSEITLNSED